MHRTLSVIGTLLATGLMCFGQEVIAHWDFNSVSPDNDPSTGTVLPKVGSGSVSLVGGPSAVFAAGSPNDPEPTDNSGWSSSSYPAQGASNKTAGVQFSVDTVGYSKINIYWEQKVSSS